MTFIYVIIGGLAVGATALAIWEHKSGRKLRTPDDPVPTPQTEAECAEVRASHDTNNRPDGPV